MFLFWKMCLFHFGRRDPAGQRHQKGGGVEGVGPLHGLLNNAVQMLAVLGAGVAETVQNYFAKATCKIALGSLEVLEMPIIILIT
jgi:hypothetical protein